jgi:microcystin-dependent protein
MEPFLGEIRMFSFGKVPRGWMPCAGQTLSIMQNQPLYSLLGLQFGGDGVNTFKLPDLRGRVPLGTGPVNPQGQMGGEETHALDASEIPVHTHQVTAASAIANQTNITGNYWASTMSFTESSDATMSSNAVSTSGASAPHDNMQPYLSMNFCIAIAGVYPPRP